LVLKEQKVAVITGSSTGIGFETCLLFARSGIRTYATMRDLTKAHLIKDISVILSRFHHIYYHHLHLLLLHQQFPPNMQMW
jgi:NAD(P)-dependent dehydrogenase (short-subunit alcohol dehydrogenase family)